MEKITILGLGSMATALAAHLSKNGREVYMWGRSAVKCADLELNRTSREYLTGVLLPENVHVTNDIGCVAGSGIVVFAVPAQMVRQVASLASPFLSGCELLLSASKGIEEGSLLRISEVLREIIPQCENVVFSGPGHAEEIAAGLPTTYVAAGTDERLTGLVQDTFMSESFRIYTQCDVIGAELGGAVKNVIALAAGISDGIGFGDNAKAALVTRGLHEITRLGVAIGAKPMTFAGLTGIGDLIVTCTSMHSRNRRCGILLGKGKTLSEALEEIHTVVEGVTTARSAYALGEKFEVDLPIVREINNLLFHGKSPRQAVLDLMTRDKTSEQKFF